MSNPVVFWVKALNRHSMHKLPCLFSHVWPKARGKQTLFVCGCVAGSRVLRLRLGQAPLLTVSRKAGQLVANGLSLHGISVPHGGKRNSCVPSVKDLSCQSCAYRAKRAVRALRSDYSPIINIHPTKLHVACDRPGPWYSSGMGMCQAAYHRPWYSSGMAMNAQMQSILSFLVNEFVIVTKAIFVHVQQHFVNIIIFLSTTQKIANWLANMSFMSRKHVFYVLQPSVILFMLLALIYQRFGIGSILWAVFFY